MCGARACTHHSADADTPHPPHPPHPPLGGMHASPLFSIRPSRRIRAEGITCLPPRRRAFRVLRTFRRPPA